MDYIDPNILYIVYIFNILYIYKFYIIIIYSGFMYSNLYACDADIF